MDQSFDEEVQKLRNQNPNVRILNQAELSDFQQKTDYKNLQQKWVSEQVKAGFTDMPEVLQKMTEIIE